MEMTLLPLIHGSAFLFYILCIVFIINRKPVTHTKVCGALLFGAFAIWSLGDTLVYLSYNVSQATFWFNVGSIGWCIFPFLGLQFYLEFTENLKLARNRIFHVFTFLPVPVFAVLQWSGFLLNDIAYKSFGWTATWHLSANAAFFIAYYCILTTISIFLCIQMGRKADSKRKKKQALLLIVTGSTAMLLASLSDVILPITGIEIMPCLGDAIIVIWGIGVILAVTKYGLLGLTPSTAADTIINTMNDSLLLIDRKGRIALVNEAARRKFSNCSNLIGLSFTQAVTEPQKAAAFLQTAFTPGRRSKIELTFKISGGEEIPMDISASVVADKTEPLLGLVIVARDMRAKMKDEREIREQKNLISEILDTVPNAVLAVNSNLQIQRANKAFLRMMGLTELRNSKIDSIFMSEECIKNMSMVLNDKKESCSFDFRYKFDEIEKIFSASIIKMGRDMALVMLNDITTEREKQEKLYLADRLATVGEMASGVAHELNNPLTSVIALSKMLLDHELPLDVHEDIGYIHSEAQRAAVIVKNMLTFARKHAAVKQLTPVNKVLEDMIKIRAYEHKINNINVQTCLQKDLPEIMANYFQIQQVFLNIILNAENAVMEKTGTERLLTITSAMDGECIRISFADNGPGIPPENIDRVFDPFFTTKEVGKGTGLGLSICYGILASHKGRITVKSELGQGTTFVVELPMHSSDPYEETDAVISSAV